MGSVGGKVNFENCPNAQQEEKAGNMIGNEYICDVLEGKRMKAIYETISTESVCSVLAKPEGDDPQLRKLVAEDSILPASVEYVGGVRKPSEFRNILVTGATGQLGPYIIRELSKHRHLNLYCIIRATNEKSARDRLIQCLRKNDIFGSTSLDNVHCLPGNISADNFGMSEPDYFELAAKIDSIVHSAVKAHHAEDYIKVSNFGSRRTPLTDIRSANVLGTKQILKFATTTTTKTILYVSSLVACTIVEPDGRFSEDFPEKDNFGVGIQLGYALSKLVCEKLVGEAVERGIPCKVVRLLFLGGDSKTGKFVCQGNHYFSMMFSAIQMGIYPDVLRCWSPLPVDVAAALIIQLFLNDDAENGCYNLTNPHVATSHEVIALAKEFGWDIEIVPHSEFRKSVIQMGEQSMLALFGDIYFKHNGLMHLMHSCHALYGILMDEASHGFSSKMRKYLPDGESDIPKAMDTLSKHFQWARSSGFLKQLNVETVN